MVVDARSQSGWGDDEVQHEKEELRKQREEVAMLKENLQEQVRQKILQVYGTENHVYSNTYQVSINKYQLCGIWL